MAAGAVPIASNLLEVSVSFLEWVRHWEATWALASWSLARSARSRGGRAQLAGHGSASCRSRSRSLDLPPILLPLGLEQEAPSPCP